MEEEKEGWEVEAMKPEKTGISYAMWGDTLERKACWSVGIDQAKQTMISSYGAFSG